MKAGLSEIYGDDGPEDYNVEMKKAKPEKSRKKKLRKMMKTILVLAR